MRTMGVFKRRGVAAGLYLVVIALAGYMIGMPFMWHLESATNLDETGGVTSIVTTLAFVGLHVLFLWPIRKPGAAGDGRGIVWSLIVAGLLVGALATGLVLAVGNAVIVVVGANNPSDEFIGWAGAGVLAAGWLVSTPLLIAFTRRGRPESVLQRLSARLFMGTIVEAAAIIPLDVLVRRREDCVCATGTYLGLSLCGAVGLFVMGPAVLLPLLAKRRRRWYAGRCEVCGYDMTTTTGLDRCPECGSGWRPPR
ncbi:MAG: hypothetical protein SFY69_07235 [Planctomycetota bacterium]|nr:hypothetical protein [Planctomycetota bacterium]